jgi:hypothetical protein
MMIVGAGIVVLLLGERRLCCVLFALFC